MSASNTASFTKAVILPMTNSGLAYFKHHLPKLDIDYDYRFSKATTHPTITGNESFSIKFTSGEWMFSYSSAGTTVTGDVIAFCRLVKRNNDLSEAHAVMIIADELNLDLPAHAQNVVMDNQVDSNPAIENPSSLDHATLTVIDQEQPIENTDAIPDLDGATPAISPSLTEGIQDESIVDLPESPVLPAIIHESDCQPAESASSETISDVCEEQDHEPLDNDPRTSVELTIIPTDASDTDSEDDVSDEEETQHGPGFVSARELLEMEITEVPTLLRPFLPATGLVAVVGSSDSGKSTFSRQLAIAVASDSDTFLGFELTPQRSRVIYVSTEDDKDATAALIFKQFGEDKQPKRVLSNLTYLFDTKDLIKRLDAELSCNPADLVICDSYMDLFDRGDSNSNNQVRRFLEPYANLAKKHQCLFLFIHHTGKRTDGTEPSKHNIIGSQGFEARMRAVLELRQEELGRRLLTLVKGNYVSQALKNKGFVLGFDENTLTFTMTDEHVSYSQGAVKKPTKLKYSVDWSAVFGDAIDMKLRFLCMKLFELYEMPYGSAVNYVKTQLAKSPGKIGYYQRPQSAPQNEAGSTTNDNHPEASYTDSAPESDD